MSDTPAQLPHVDVLPNDRETAYHHWAYVSDRNAAETARCLGLPVRTVQDWVTRDGWRVRYDQDRGELAQRVRDTVEVALIRAFPEVVQGFLKIFRGEGDQRQTLDKDGNLVTVYDPVPYQARVNAGKEIVALLNGPTVHLHQVNVQGQRQMGRDTPDPGSPGRGNGSPTSPHTRDLPDPSLPLTREQAAAMTPEQRHQWEAARRQR